VPGVGALRNPGGNELAGNGKVVVAYCHPGSVTGEFHESLMNLLVYDTVHEQRIIGGGGRLGFRSSANISSARNAMCEKMLAESDAEWLWMVDTDMTFDPDTLERLLAEADPDKAPIVGALCFGQEEHLLFPTMYDLVGEDKDNLQFIRYQQWPENAMFQVFATGAACLLIHRSALEAVRDYRHDDGRTGFSPVFPWFQEREFNGGPMGEDVTFCFRAGMAGLPVHVHTGVTCGHVKSTQLTEGKYVAQRQQLARAEYLAAANPEQEEQS
jgi:hypothetical protein